MSRTAIRVLLAGMLSAHGSGAANDQLVFGQDGGSLNLVLDGSGSIREGAGDGNTPIAVSLSKANADRPDDPADDEDDVEMGLGWPWVIGGLLVLAAMAVGLLAAIRRQRGKVDAERGT